MKPQITVEGNNKFHHDTEMNINSSRTEVLSIAGSHNRGVMLNEAHFNVNPIMEQPVFFYLTQYHTFIYAILIFFLCCTPVGLFVFFYNRRIKPPKSSPRPRVTDVGSNQEARRALSQTHRNLLFSPRIHRCVFIFFFFLFAQVW